MNVWILACVIVLFFEGAMLAVAPKAWQKMMWDLLQLPAEKLRKIGFTMTITAVLLIFLMKWLS